MATTFVSGVLFMYKLLITLLLALHAPFVFGQTERQPFHVLMDKAKLKKVITVDTVAGKTNVLITSMTEHPAWIFVFSPGGEGTLLVEADAQGAPLTKRLRVPIYPLAPAFLERDAAWVAIDVPESYGIAISREQRQEPRHVEAITQVARKLREEFPKSRHILIGHSNGGITAAMQSALDKPPFDGIVFSAPNIAAFPSRWEPSHAKVPVKFIVHEHDECGGGRGLGINTRTIHMAGRRFPLTVIKSPSPGNRQECFAMPAPHFFTDTYTEYTDAILKWAASLK